MQYPNVWLRSVADDHGGVRGPEWRQLEHGKCHHGQGSQGRSKQRQNFRFGEMDPIESENSNDSVTYCFWMVPEHMLRQVIYEMYKAPQTGDIMLMDAPTTDTWNELPVRTYAWDRDYWRVRVRSLRQPRPSDNSDSPRLPPRKWYDSLIHNIDINAKLQVPLTSKIIKWIWNESEECVCTTIFRHITSNTQYVSAHKLALAHMWLMLVTHWKWCVEKLSYTHIPQIHFRFILWF